MRTLYGFEENTLDDLIYLGEWQALADHVAANLGPLGTWCISGFRIGVEEALALAAHLPTHLRGDWADGDFHVTRERPEQ